MPQTGFFTADELSTVSPVASLIPRCGACGIYRQCKSPKMPVSGQGKQGVLIVGEAPGAVEDEQGKPFVGESGQLLRETLERLDVNVDRDCWVTNSLICRPPKNRTPTDKEIDYCRPNLINTIEEVQPKTIVLLGAVPVKSLIGWLWREQVGALGRWIGWRIPCQKLNAWICPA